MTRAARWMLALTLPIALAGGPAFAQGTAAAPPTGAGTPPPGTSAGMAPPPDSNATAPAPGTGMAMPGTGTGMGNGQAMESGKAGTARLSRADRSFLMKAAAGGMAEVQAAQIAQGKSQNDEVKSFAQKMIDDHTPNNKELMDIAAQKGATPPSTLPKKQQAELDRLQAMDGSKFDAAYLREQVRAHKQMLSAFQTEMKDGSDPDLKSFAQKTIPVIQSHIDMAKGDMQGAKG